MRRRLPLVVFLLLLVLALLLLGFVCACIADHPALAIERALSALTALPPLTAVWSLLVVALALASTPPILRQPSLARGSPAELQRFLF
jgi:hypothetical protein